MENDDENKPINYENINEEELENFVKISKKVVNLEAFPFRSSSPNFYIKDEGVDACEKRFANCLVKSTTEVSMLSARIIIWRILKYIDSNKKTKFDQCSYLEGSTEHGNHQSLMCFQKIME